MTGFTGLDRQKRSCFTGSIVMVKYLSFYDQPKLYRFVVEGSVEERILQLQATKLALASEVLSGSKRTGANKLSFDDLKMLFQVP